MKKVFLSIPVGSRSAEDVNLTIEKMKGLAKVYLYPEDEIEFFTSVSVDKSEDGSPMKINRVEDDTGEILKGCDIFFTCFATDTIWLSERFPWCFIELRLAMKHNLKIISAFKEKELLLPDLVASHTLPSLE